MIFSHIVFTIIAMRLVVYSFHVFPYSLYICIEFFYNSLYIYYYAYSMKMKINGKINKKRFIEIYPEVISADANTSGIF